MRAVPLYAIKHCMTATPIEQSYLRTDLPAMGPGDTVRVYQKIKEGDKERVSAFEGIVIATKHGQGITGSYTVRKVVDGIGVERVFPLHSPMVERVELIRRGSVRRAKLYYIRDKAAREVRRKIKSIFMEANRPQKKTPIVADETDADTEDSAKEEVGS